jgi:hypothetical protein
VLDNNVSMREVHVRHMSTAMRCNSQPATSHCETATIVRLWTTSRAAPPRANPSSSRQPHQERCTNRASLCNQSIICRVTLPPAGCWRWLGAGLLGRPRRTPLVVNLQPAYCKLHVLSLVPACPSSKRRIIVLFRLSLSKGWCRGPSGGSSSPPPCAFGVAV